MRGIRRMSLFQSVALLTAISLLGCTPGGNTTEGDVVEASESNGSDVREVSYATFYGLSAQEVWNRIEMLDYREIPLEAPEDYYSRVDTGSSEALRSSLHTLISDHDVHAYTGSGDPRDATWTVDVWDIIMVADQNPEDETKVIDLYRNASYDRVHGGTDVYNREHAWPKSRGFDSKSSPAYTDCHHIFACDSGFNSSRSNSFYGEVRAAEAGSVKCTEANLGRGGTTVCNYGIDMDSDPRNDFWQVWSGRRGDVARTMLYMAVRYDGDAPREPDLVLTDDAARQETDCKECYSTGSTAYMGLLDALLTWHEEDPVDQYERRRNTVVYLFQGNRNPFVDHPEWVVEIFGAE